MITIGIDVYLEWDNMTKEEEEARYTGFSVVSGHVGYLREAYHGEPYATMELVTEDWAEQPEDGFVIKNSVLKKRLAAVLEAAEERQRTLYPSDDEDEVEAVKKSFSDFVKLHGKKEKAGLNPRIIISY